MNDFMPQQNLDQSRTTVEDFVRSLQKLEDQRNDDQKKAHKVRRKRHTAKEREAILKKTDGICHMCGGQIVANRWEADHVLRHAFGGGNGPDNFLAIDWLCNSYRLDYSPKEMQWILKIGVWARTQMAKSNSECGREMAKLFFDKELRRERRNELRRENRKEANGPK